MNKPLTIALVGAALQLLSIAAMLSLFTAEPPPVKLAWRDPPPATCTIGPCHPAEFYR